MGKTFSGKQISLCHIFLDLVYLGAILGCVHGSLVVVGTAMVPRIKPGLANTCKASTLPIFTIVLTLLHTYLHKYTHTHTFFSRAFSNIIHLWKHWQWVYREIWENRYFTANTAGQTLPIKVMWINFSPIRILLLT